MKNWSIIVAVGERNEIGKNNDLLWHISADLKRFKSITTGHTIVMGRKTFESLPKGALPKRRNIILSHQNLKFENAEVFSNLEELISATKDDKQVFVIGGASLYQFFINKVDQMYLTQVHATFDADVFFPNFDKNNWTILEEESFQKDDKTPFAYTFLKLKRKA